MNRKHPFIRFVETPGEDTGGSEDTAENEGTQEVSEEDAGEGTNDEEESEGGWDQARAMDKIRKANAEAKSQRERAKAAEAKAGNADEALARAETAEKKLLRVTEAVRLGLPVELADRLQGDTPEEIAQDAEKLLALFSPRGVPAPTNRPKPRLQGGARPSEDSELDAKAIVDAALGR